MVRFPRFRGSWRRATGQLGSLCFSAVLLPSPVLLFEPARRLAADRCHAAVLLVEFTWCVAADRCHAAVLLVEFTWCVAADRCLGTVLLPNPTLLIEPEPWLDAELRLGIALPRNPVKLPELGLRMAPDLLLTSRLRLTPDLRLNPAQRNTLRAGSKTTRTKPQHDRAPGRRTFPQRENATLRQLLSHLPHLIHEQPHP
ncbi:hypothetical protein, partial [Nocardia ninae]|uniref:hypothetical protein n=1 Tax=Nocardia ninae TaxID=356145 RepID=UPI0039F10818